MGGTSIVSVNHTQKCMTQPRSHIGRKVVLHRQRESPTESNRHKWAVDRIRHDSVQPGGGPRALVDVVVTEAYKSSASTNIAGHAVGGAEQRKLRHYSDYPRSDPPTGSNRHFRLHGPLLPHLIGERCKLVIRLTSNEHAGSLLVILASPSVSLSAASSGPERRLIRCIRKLVEP
eukprot:SM000065S20200  [mRNA]  locus=s65:250011:250606:- [translate_table: standard]